MPVEDEDANPTQSGDAPASAPGWTGTQAWISGHFELLEQLGHGSSGTVYRARLKRRTSDLAIGEEVAIKFLRRELLDDPEARERLETEGRIGKQIRSPQVVRIYAVENLRLLGLTATYLVMELIRGHSLRQLLTGSGSVVEALAQRIGLDTARGLRAVHELGLVHRDIKPENLALTDEGTVKVMDLGLVRRFSRRDQNPSAGFYGSLSYAAPEVLRGEPARPASDLYSLGVVLFEIVTGHHPFTVPGDDPDEMIHAHLNLAPPRPSHFKPRISAFLEQMILDLLAKRPSDRPVSAAALVTRFEGGENSRYWIRREQRAPLLASRRRLRELRRVAETDFVGRRAEWRALDGHLRSAVDGRGRAVFVRGPAGSGRRRLLDEWLDDILTRRNDVLFLGGEAKGGAGLHRAAPFSEMLLDWYLRGDQPDSPLAQTRLAARIAAESDLDGKDAAHLAAIVGSGEMSATPEERADLLARHFVAMRPAGQTLILRVDHAEELSTTADLVVKRITDALGDHQILLLVVAMDNQRPAPGMIDLPIVGLSEAEYLAFAQLLFSPKAVPTDLIRAAHRTLAGSPGNLLDALAALARDRKIAGSVGNYLLGTEVRELRPAQPLLTRLRKRMAALSKEERFIHLAAAVLGQSFPIADLEALVGQSELAVLETLSIFKGRIILTQRGRGRFRHRDFRKEMLKIAPPHARRRLHRTAAWVLEDRGAPALEIGLHLSRAGEHEAAIPPLLDGLAHLTATGSRQSSQRIVNRLRIHFQALGEASEREPLRLRFLLLAGQTHALGHKFERAREAFATALEVATRIGDPNGLAEAHLAAGGLDLHHGALQTALVHVQTAQRVLPKATPRKDLLRARALSLEARICGYLGQSEIALERIQAALGTLPDGDSDLRPNLHVDLARLEALRNHFVAALKSLERAEILFTESASANGHLRVRLHQGHILATLGSRRQATSLLRQAEHRARQLTNHRAQARARLFLGELLGWHGARDQAIEHLEAAVSLATSPGDHVTRLRAGIYLMDFDREPPELETQVRDLGVPALRIGWLLAAAKRSGDATLLDEAVAIERTVTVPLHLHLDLLHATGRSKAAGILTREIAGRLPAGYMRRRFQSFVKP